jgi:hypothetical protein
MSRVAFGSGERSRRLALRVPILQLAVAIVLGVALPAASPAGAKHKAGSSGGVCSRVSQDVFQSCLNGTQDDYWIAVAQCDNTASAATCRRSALDDQKDALGECRDERIARNDVCSALGGAAYAPVIHATDFPTSTAITNPFLPLVPGTTFHYRASTAAGVELNDVEVTSATRRILGVDCVVVHDVVALNGEISEDTLDWFTQDAAGNVWYFGEESKQYAQGVLIGIEGSWMAGVDGAFPGIVMEAQPSPGDFYRQEYKVGEAEDVARVVATGQSVSVPYGSFGNALETEEFSGMEPGSVEHKFYVPGLGFVLSVDAETGEREELVSVTP